MKIQFNIAFVGCKSRSTRSKEEGMEGKEWMIMKKKGWRLQKISYWGVAVIAMGSLPLVLGVVLGLHVDQMGQSISLQLHHPLYQAKVTRSVIWLRVSSLFSWKITYVWSPKSFLKKIYKERICAYQIWRSLIVVMGFVLFLEILCHAQSSMDLWSNFCFQCKLQK